MTTLRSLACVVAAVVGSAAAAAAQDGRREVEAGNRLYDEGRYQEAHARYLEALRQVPGLPLARFNEGSALYQSQEFERAMEAFLEAAEGADPEWRAGALYNLGNALVRQQQPGPAAEAYKQALRLDPGDVDAKHNLELALRQLEQQEQQQGGEGGEGDEGQEGDDQNQDPQQGQDQQPPEGDDEGEQQDDPSQEGDGQQQPPGSEDGQPNDGSEPRDPQDGDGPSGTPPPKMTPEQAERLLQAIAEEPGEVNRKAAQARGARPRKDW